MDINAFYDHCRDVNEGSRNNSTHKERSTPRFDGRGSKVSKIQTQTT